MTHEALTWWKETLAEANRQRVPAWYLAWQELDLLRCRVSDKRENKGGRPRKLSDADVKRAADMRARGMTLEQIAKEFGCQPRTIALYLRRDT